MSETLKTVFSLAGGLALFLFGMNGMSDALQKAAGDRMKRVLGFLTRSPALGALAGALVTAVLQSSSATTVMTIGFVSAGLMSLPQAISVVFGANVGTTMTAQLMAFKIDDYVYPILFAGFLTGFLSRRERARALGNAVFFFGLLFEGIEIMGGAMRPLAGSPVFTSLMARVSRVPALGVLLGAFMTLTVQSSSATIAVLQNFAQQAGPDGVHSVIGLAGAIPILLGDNIGTTITALLAAVGQSKDAKRTALAHSFFNISGSVVFACLLPLFVRFVEFISPKGPELLVISRQIANAHTAFNALCTLAWLPLIPVMVKLVTFFVRGGERAREADGEPRYLDGNVLGQPMVALFLVSSEIGRLSGLVADALSAARGELTGARGDPGAFDAAYASAKRLQDAVVAYISRMFARGGLTAGQSERTAGLLFIVNDMGRVADRFREMADVARRVRGEGRTFSAEALRDLEQCFAIADGLFHGALRAVTAGDAGYAAQAAEGRDAMRAAQKRFTRAHLARVEENACDAALTRDYSDILYGFDRVVDNCAGIAEEVTDGVRLVALGETGARGGSEA